MFWFTLILIVIWQFITEMEQKATNERMRVLEERLSDLEGDKCPT